MHKIRLLLFLGLLFLVGCTSAGGIITPADAKAMLDADEAILIDVRTLEEFETERIPGAILVSLADIEAGKLSKMADKNETYIIYCRSGNRSAQAVQILKEEGYKHLYDLGGIINWPYETISG
ncbi:MAG: rhodanese-like domain-containing protein [Bacilli bacterium]|nr:rhodanese-like domain-containing protein [Bacilli bacterium]MDY0064243.1 rhodanese-like domain-containing protein [Bacilli bacterium]